MSYHQMKRRKEAIAIQIKKLKNKIMKFPAGTLICTQNKKYCKWYCKDGKTRTYIPKTNRVLAEKLAMKKYYSLQLEELLREEQALEAYFQKYNSKSKFTTEQFLENPEYIKLIAPFYKPLSIELKEWAAQPYEKCNMFPERLIHQTLAGIKVRSKSEAMIVACLYQNRIPFRYECALQIGKRTIFPDFTIRHPKTGELYYWEHFGRMDEEKYLDSFHEKIKLYTQNGIIPMIHLITTYETKESPLSMTVIEKMVQHYFGE